MPSILDYNPGVDALQSLGQVPGAVAGGQYRGMELGLQRQRLLMDYSMRQQEMQRLAQQAQALQQYRQQQQELGQQREDETRKFHVTQQNQFALKYHDNIMNQHLKAKGKWKIDSQNGVIFNDTTGEVKPLFGGTNAPTGGLGTAGGARNNQANAATLGHILQAIPQVNSMGTNAPPTVMPGLTNMLGQLEGRMFPQQPPGTNAAPQPPRISYDPQVGDFVTNALPPTPGMGQGAGVNYRAIGGSQIIPQQ